MVRWKDPNANKGLDFETKLLLMADRYQREGLAYLQRFEVPKGFNPKTRKMFYREKTGYDFVGARWVPEVRPLFVEAKSNDRGSLPLEMPGAKGGNGVAYHQLETMVKLQALGAECWIVWRDKHNAKVYRISPVWAMAEVGPGHVVSPTKHHLETVPMVGLSWDFLKLF